MKGSHDAHTQEYRNLKNTVELLKIPLLCHFCFNNMPWWLHQMETCSASLDLCAGIQRSPVNSPHKSQWHGALMFYLICVWINCWGWWFETPSHPLWRLCNANEIARTSRWQGYSVDGDQTLIQCESIGSLSNRCRSEGPCWAIHLVCSNMLCNNFL